MPELPEVETVARGVDKRVRGDRVVETWFSTQPQPFKTPRAKQARGLAGRTFLSVHRTGKHIVCELSAPGDTPAAAPRRKRKEPTRKHPEIDADQIDARLVNAHPIDAHQIDAQWIVHLGMTGRLLVTTAEEPVAKHTHARLMLASGRELRFVDPRRFGRLEFRELKRGPASGEPGSTDRGFAAPGAEPLTIGADDFAALFHGRRTPIKAALLNQSLLSGVGNIYADESLFHAGVRPRRHAGRLTRAELERLRGALRQVLQQAIKLGGSSVSDYVDAEGSRGFFQLEHCVYMRTAEPCRHCKTPIQRIVLAGRGTHFCPQCQR